MMTKKLPSFLFNLSQLVPEQTPAVDLHMHTNWTDGANTVQEMYSRACELGLTDIAFSEHARRTSIKWFTSFASQIRALPKRPCRAWIGVETRVQDQQGNLEVGKDITDICDLVIGSVHRFPDINGDPIAFDAIDPKSALELEFRLSLALLDNPILHVLGHPFGMTYTKYGLYPSDAMFLTLIEKASETGTAIEINARYHPDPLHIMTMCLNTGAHFSLGSDAHSIQEVGRIALVLKGKRPL